MADTDIACMVGWARQARARRHVVRVGDGRPTRTTDAVVFCGALSFSLPLSRTQSWYTEAVLV